MRTGIYCSSADLLRGIEKLDIDTLEPLVVKYAMGFAPAGAAQAKTRQQNKGSMLQEVYHDNRVAKLHL
jgi:hypothetical protein